MGIVLLLWIVNMFVWFLFSWSKWADKKSDMWVLGLLTAMVFPAMPWIIYLMTKD